MSQTPEEIALKRIRKNAESKAETLNLSSLELNVLPDELFELKHLRELDLSDNQFSALPTKLWKLPNLKRLAISVNPLPEIPSELWQKNDWELLGLGGLKLKTLPPEILQLSNLVGLGIFSNRLTSLPPEIGQLTNLIEIGLRDNRFTSFPLEILQLSNLTTLWLSSNQLTSLPPEIGQLSNLTGLDLSDNQLTSLPPEIEQLTNLTGLDLSDNQFSTLPTKLWKLPNLKRLAISVNPLPEIPSELWQKNDWELLGLESLNLKTLPLEIGQLTNLTELDLSNNQLTSLPSEIGKLTNLTTLNLSNNQLTSLPPEIGKLSNLTTLNLSSNQLTSLPPEIGQLSDLTKLKLTGNQFSSLPPKIGKLSNLTTLNLSSNQLTSLPLEIGKLSNLTKLYLVGNQFSSLPLEIGKLFNLAKLFLSGNQLTSLPPDIGKLSNLTTLFLVRNQLSSLPPEIGQLSNLTELELSENQLNELPKEIAELNKLNRINLHNNPLGIAIPTKWLRKKKKSGGGFAQEILTYYKQMYEEGGRALGEARVLVVGEADAGKTKLLRALLYGEYGNKFKDTRDATGGIEISEMKNGDITTRLWDFGGQEIMHATHRFFLSRRCVYIVVADATRDRDYNQAKIEYWLELIKSYGGDSPILLVSSKSESFALDINKNDLQEKYPNLVRGAVLATSAKSGKGIEELKSAIFEQAEKLPSVKVMLPKSFIAVKDKIEKIKDKKQATVMEEKEFRNLCHKNNITDEERQNVLLQLLHDMGVVLHYENDDRLSDFGILNPEWATTGVYKLINSSKIKESQGKFTLAEIKHLLQDEVAYPATMRRRIVDLMKKFELSYELPLSPDTFILPSALPANQPELKEWDENTMAFEYEYPILRVSVLHRFMVKKHELIHNEQIWYSGVVLANKTNQALIKADFNKRKILIKVKGDEATRKDFLYLIRTEFENIHGEESQPAEFVYHPKYADLPLSFNEMKILAKTDTEYKKVYKNQRVIINLRELLDGFVTPEERAKDEKRERNEDRYMSKPKNDNTKIEVNIHGGFSGGNLVIGDENKIVQKSSQLELQSILLELIKASELLLTQVQDSQARENIQEELDDLQKQAEKTKPNKDKVKISVEGLKKAAENLSEIGQPVLELAMTVIKLINNLPA